MAVDAVVYYRINNPMISVLNVENANRSTQLLAATTLRNILGMKTLSEILSEREVIAGSMQVSGILRLWSLRTNRPMTRVRVCRGRGLVLEVT